MGEFWKSFLTAVKGNRDILAFLGIGLILVIALVSRVTLMDALAVGAFLGILWLGMRWGLSKLHGNERLRELRNDAKIEAVKALAKHVPKGDVRATIETLLKDVDK